MGSELRFDYTVTGDGVNLASRLEGANKESGTNIIVSESTWEQVRDRITTRELDIIRVQGKAQPTRIFEVFGMPPLAPERAAIGRLFEVGLRAYRAQYWQAVIENFQQVLAVVSDDPPSQLFEPIGMDRGLHLYDVRIDLVQLLFGGFAALQRAVVHDPEQAWAGPIRLLHQHVMHQAAQRRDAGRRCTPTHGVPTPHVLGQRGKKGPRGPILRHRRRKRRPRDSAGANAGPAGAQTWNRRILAPGRTGAVASCAMPSTPDVKIDRPAMHEMT